MSNFSYYPMRSTSTPQVGQLATALVWTPDGDKFACVRINRVDAHNAWVSAIGFELPYPYQVGDHFVVDIEKVVDWE